MLNKNENEGISPDISFEKILTNNERNRIEYSTNNSVPPIKPVCSTKEANAKSVCASGKNLNLL